MFRSVSRRLPLILLGVAMAASAVLLLWLGRDTGFIDDEWYFWTRHPVTLGKMLEPGNGNLMAIPIFTYKVVIKLFGLAYLPYRIIEVALVLASAGMFFLALRAGERRREWIALGAAVLMLFFGTSWDVIETPLGMPVVLGVALGFGALMAAERNSWKWDAVTLLLLAVGFLSFTVTVSFAIAIAVIMVLDRPRRWLRLAIPTVLLLLYAGYRYHYRYFPTVDGKKVTLDHILHTPVSLLESLKAGLLSLVGIYPLEGLSDPVQNVLAVFLALGLVAFVAWRVSLGTPINRRVWAYLAALIAFWLSLAVVGKEPLAVRYQYTSVIFLLAIVVEMVDGVRLAAPLKLATAAVLVFALFSNTAQLFEKREVLTVTTRLNEAKLAGLEIIRDQVPSNFGLQQLANPEAPDWKLDIFAIEAGDYFEAAGRDGSPAMSEAELRAAGEEQRESADRLMLNGLQLPERLTPAPLAGCRRALPAGGEWVARTGPLSGAGFGVRAGAAAVVGQPRRYAEVATTYPLLFPRGAATWAEVPADLSPVRWRIELRSRAPFEACLRRAP